MVETVERPAKANTSARQTVKIAHAARPAEQQAKPGIQSGAERLLAFHASIRSCATLEELQFHAVNELRPLLTHRQSFLMNLASKPRMVAVSSLTKVDRNVPLTRWVEAMAGQLCTENDPTVIHQFELPAFSDSDPDLANSYPFTQWLWIPLTDAHKQLRAALLLARTDLYTPVELELAKELAADYAYAWAALETKPAWWTWRGLSCRLRKWWPWTLLMAGLAMFFPVTMTALAPAEVVAHEPVVIAAPLTGVVDEIVVKANASVKQGDLLVRFDDTELRNELKLAQRAIEVAQAGLLKTSGSAFNDPSKKRELALARAELKVRQAERNYTQAMLTRTELRAPRDGIAVFDDPLAWAGKPVSTGERIMALANEREVALQVELGVNDAITLKQDGQIRMFLHADPLDPIDARVTHAAYRAQPTSDGNLAYQIRASFPDATQVPRIGLRGTARLQGEPTFLGFYLFRRPLTALRQHLGW